MGRAIGRESNLKFFVNSKDLDKLAELVKTKSRRSYFEVPPMNASMIFCMTYLYFFQRVFFMSTNAISLFRIDLSLWDKDS